MQIRKSIACRRDDHHFDLDPMGVALYYPNQLRNCGLLPYQGKRGTATERVILLGALDQRSGAWLSAILGAVVDSQSVHESKGHLEGNCPANHNSMLTPPTFHRNSPVLHQPPRSFP